MKVLSLVKNNIEVVLFVGILVGLVSLIIYNCITIGTTCYFSV